MIDIAKLKTTQHKLNRAHRLPELVERIKDGEDLESVQIACLENGDLLIENGHHRVVAAWLAGKRFLRKHEYLLVDKDWSHRRPQGGVNDLVISISLHLVFERRLSPQRD